MWLFTPWLFFYRPKQPIQLKRPETKRVISAMVRLAGSPCLPGRNKVRRLLPPATKLGQGYTFTGVCDFVHGRGGVLSQHALQVVSQHASYWNAFLFIDIFMTLLYSNFTLWNLCFMKCLVKIWPVSLIYKRKSSNLPGVETIYGRGHGSSLQLVQLSRRQGQSGWLLHTKSSFLAKST